MINAFCKKPLWECTRTLADVAQGRRPADVVVKSARLVNVCTAEVQDGADVAIAEGRIAYVGQANHCVGSATQVIDAEGCYIAPGFLDGHVHVESSLVGAGEFARAVVPHGTTGIYWDPHEVCNVLGLEGVQAMMKDVQRTPLKAMVTTPSCVPAVPGFEDTGAAIGPNDIAETMAWDSVVGLGEMMNFVGIVNGSEQPHAEVAETLKAGKIVTGHYASSETDRGLGAYAASGVRCCHESAHAEEVLAKMRLGMYAQLRFGSAGRDLPQLAAAVVSGAVDTRFACLVTDDVHPHELVEDGHMDRVLREAVRCGIDPVAAVQMATINTAQCFQMDHELGSITPGKCADIVFLDDLHDFRVSRVMIDGTVVAEEGAPTFQVAPFAYPEWAVRSMHVRDKVTPASFTVELPKGASVRGGRAIVRAIEVAPGSIGTKEVRVELAVRHGSIQADPAHDVLKAFVFERHRATGRIGCGFVQGFGIQRGAMASTVAHDAHNLFVVGANDADMALAANTLIACGGGQAVVADGEVLALMKLPIAGIMAEETVEEASCEVHALEQAWEELGCAIPAPFMPMAFIPLACLPELRLTDRGLVDCTTFQFAQLAIEE